MVCLLLMMHVSRDISQTKPYLPTVFPPVPQAALFSSCGEPLAIGCESVRDSHDAQQGTLLSNLIQTIHHFFGGLKRLFAEVTDPRLEANSDYPLSCLLTTGLLMFACHLGARRQIALQLRNARGARKMKTLCGVEAVPHGDTLNNAFEQLDPDQMQEVVCSMVENLIRNKVLDRYRFLGRFVIAVDGTGLWTFSERHCKHCLTATHGNQTIYYHNTLEAKLVTSDGFVFSLMTEFIENVHTDQTKQDCELKAFYRLAERLKKRFPRLSLLVTLDGLYAVGPVFGLCEDHDWKYLAVLKDDTLKSVNREFASLSQLQPENRLTIRRDEVVQEVSWVNDIDYTDTEGRSHKVNVLQCVDGPATPTTGKTSTHRWVGNVKIGSERAMDVATKGGRIRWKIENEGFNVQKNRGYRLEHAYSKNPVAAKVFYYLLQVAHTISQLLEKGSLLRKSFPKGFGSAKNLALRLLEAWRNLSVWTAETLSQLLRERIQIRLNSS
jgi:hypothetical protein